MKLNKEEFKSLDKDKKVYLYTLENSAGMKVVLSDWGATIVNIFVKDKDDNLVDVTLGHLSFEQYKTNPGNLGCVVGRNANRIANAKVVVDEVEYDLEKNDGENNLHTGSKGLATTLFNAEATDSQITFFTTVKDLEDGFPGDLDVEVEYTLSDDNTLNISYRAKSNKDTIVNLTNHNYFNLNGQDESTIYDHTLKIDSNFYSPNSKQSLPTGEILKVDDTAFDFIEAKELRKSLEVDEEQIKTFNGIDHNFLLNKDGFRIVASLYNPKNKIKLEVFTDRNAMHVYTANHFPDSDTINKDNLTYPLHGGIAFETQSVPNALNMPWLKSPLLKANEIYHTSTAFKFTVE